MPDSVGDSTSAGRTITGWRTVSRFYRRPFGLGWLLALALIPLLLALLGHSFSDRAALSAEGLGGSGCAPATIDWNGEEVVLSGKLASAGERDSLVQVVKAAFGPQVKLVDKVKVESEVQTSKFSGVSDVLGAVVGFHDAKVDLCGDEAALSGTAVSEGGHAAVVKAAEQAWPERKVIDHIKVRDVKAQGGPCSHLQGDVSKLMEKPIEFVTNGYSLSPASEAQLAGVAEKIKSCDNAQVNVAGHTDNTGNDAINVPLSANRAKAVADFLVAQGIPAANVTSEGLGATQPVADNGTDEGKAKNRRTEITVN